MIAGYLAFVLLMPAASFFIYRLTYPILGPMLVLAAILIAMLGRLVLRRYAILVMPLLVLAGMVVVARDGIWPRYAPLNHSSIYGTIDYLRSIEIPPDTRIYALPYEHLSLMFYTGLPVQSIAPVRRSFLHRYEGNVLIIETVNRYPLLTAKSIQQAAAAEGQAISPQQAREFQDRFNTIARREDLRDRVASAQPAMEPVPSFVRRAIDQQRLAATRPQADRSDEFWGNPAIFRGFDVPSRWGFWSVFFYRFIDPASRSGDANVNYANRIRGATAVVLPWDWVVYHCPPLPVAPTTSDSDR